MMDKILNKVKKYINKNKNTENKDIPINQEQMISAIKEVTKELMQQDINSKKLVHVEIDDETGYGIATIGDTSFVTIITLTTLVDQLEVLLEKIVTPQSDKKSVLTLLGLLEESKKLTLLDIKDKISIPPHLINKISL